MSYICRACSEIYDNDLDVSGGCPKQRCGGETSDMIWVDDAFAPTVAEFNKKGLEVEVAYFGTPLNVVYDAPRIVFCNFLFDEFTEDDFKQEVFGDLSGDWRFKVGKIHELCTDDTLYPMIECVFYGGTDIEKQERFLKNHLELAKFAHQMDALNY